MPYTVLLKRTAERELDKLPERIYQAVIRGLRKLSDNPRPVRMKKLPGREEYCLRVGNYRILYLVRDAERIVEVISVAHRREVYRK